MKGTFRMIHKEIWKSNLFIACVILIGELTWNSLYRFLLLKFKRSISFIEIKIFNSINNKYRNAKFRISHSEKWWTWKVCECHRFYTDKNTPLNNYNLTNDRYLKCCWKSFTISSIKLYIRIVKVSSNFPINYEKCQPFVERMFVCSFQ